MTQPEVMEGTGEELEPILKQRPKQRFRLTPLPAEAGASVEQSEERLKAVPNEKALAALRKIAENQKDRPYSDGSDTQRLIREARAGAMYGDDFTE